MGTWPARLDRARSPGASFMAPRPAVNARSLNHPPHGKGAHHHARAERRRGSFRRRSRPLAPSPASRGPGGMITNGTSGGIVTRWRTRNELPRKSDIAGARRTRLFVTATNTIQLIAVNQIVATTDPADAALKYRHQEYRRRPTPCGRSRSALPLRRMHHATRLRMKHQPGHRGIATPGSRSGPVAAVRAKRPRRRRDGYDPAATPGSGTGRAKPAVQGDISPAGQAPGCTGPNRTSRRRSGPLCI
jgi:hypothetical protein